MGWRSPRQMAPAMGARVASEPFSRGLRGWTRIKSPIDFQDGAEAGESNPNEPTILNWIVAGMPGFLLQTDSVVSPR